MVLGLLWLIFGPALVIYRLFWFARYAVYCYQGRQDSTYVFQNVVYLVIHAIITCVPLVFHWEL